MGKRAIPHRQVLDRLYGAGWEDDPYVSYTAVEVTEAADRRSRGGWAHISEGICAHSFSVLSSRDLLPWELAQGDLFEGMPPAAPELPMFLRRQAA